MDISGKGTQPFLDPLIEEIKRLDLSEHVVELEAYGFTVIPPSKSGITKAWVGRLRDAILHTVERRGGVDLSDWETRTEQIPSEVMRESWELMPEDDIFAEAALQPAGLAMARWLLGQRAILGGHTYITRGPTPGEMDRQVPDKLEGKLHSDVHGVPGGGDICHECNVSILCTDYSSADDGPTILSPGSHRMARAPSPGEATPGDAQPTCVTLEGEAGSIAVWNGFTWHGSYPRKNPGLRITLVQSWMRTYMRPLHEWREADLAPGQLERYPELRKVLALDHPYPFHAENKRRKEYAWFMQAGTDRFA